MIEDFLSIHDLTPHQVSHIFDLARQIKENPKLFKNRLKDKILVMLFQKPSLRTRMTFEVGMIGLGGNAIYLGPSEVQLGIRESAYDVGKNLEQWVDGIMVRTFDHKNIIDLAQASRIPVINALSDLLHPCQGMADFLTLMEKKEDLAHIISLAYVGDGNNVCHSLLFAAAKTGGKMSIATPPGYEPNDEILKQAKEDGKETQFNIHLTNDPAEAVDGADAVYTDTWASMGQEEEKEKRLKIFSPFQVNAQLMAKAKPDALFMHCLPAHRGEEVTDEVIDSAQSVVFHQAQNRLHVQKAIMLLLLENKPKNG